MYTHHHLDKIAQDAAKYDLLANFYKYIDPAKHIYFYQMHFMCMQQLACAQQIPMQHMPMNQAQFSPQAWHREAGRNNSAKVRVFHASPDAPAVDIYVNGEKTIFEKVTYYQLTPYIDLPAGRAQIDVYPTGQTNNPVLSETVTVQEETNYTIAAAGLLNEIQLVTVVDGEGAPNQSKVRFWHLSPNAPAVDIAIQGGDILFRNVSFSHASDYLQLPPSTQDIEVRQAGTDNVVLTLRDINLRRNEVYTIAAMGLLDGRPRLEAVVIQP
ncbi:DUF4397 domain-containing protein [Bacillus sp. FJAT-45350]|uniref:DUF4397 domain-containing protein n=1 Tax=Bacillus sp. FJAT-45350 TaxID=2011014 RepID=UPI000BB7312D|nr:DUF4397 domain-containing protein [Bacillus sp. FJAT-45350]